MQNTRAGVHLRRRQARAMAILGVVAAFSFVAVAYAFYDEDYGGNTVSAGGGYVESAGAHAFVFNSTAIANSGYLTCQLVKKSGGYNLVDHAYGQCTQNATPDDFKWARGYNQSGSAAAVFGYAKTN
ncbi:MAG: hypothetical protein QOJ63_2055 [Solirubrobacteraceae bacterium]|jgi:hypothetical protein|nr:hypothetical protein [Solirubrobacteraceae bacterium]